MTISAFEYAFDIDSSNILTNDLLVSGLDHVFIAGRDMSSSNFIVIRAYYS
jgi:hypothetical protein